MTDHLRLRRRTLLGVTAALTVPTIVRAQDTVLTVGHIQAETGPSAAQGIRARDGARMAAEDINAAGGAKDASGKAWRIKIEESDMGNDARQAITLLRQYASRPEIVAVLGPTNSVGFLPMTPAAGQLHIPLIGNGSGAPIPEWNPWTYRVNPVADTATPILIRKVIQQTKAKRIGIIFDQTQEVQAADAAICRAEAGKLGYEVVADQAFRTGDQDFSAQISRIRSVRPDVIFLAAAPGDGAKVAAQLRDAGIKVPFMTGFGEFQDPTYWDASGGAIDGCYTWIAQDFAHGDTALRAWLDRYNKTFPQPANTNSAFGYDSVYALTACVGASSPPSRSSIQAALCKLDIKTPIGTVIRFQNPPQGNNLEPIVTVLRVTGKTTYDVV